MCLHAEAARGAAVGRGWWFWGRRVSPRLPAVGLDCTRECSALEGCRNILKFSKLPMACNHRRRLSFFFQEDVAEKKPGAGSPSRCALTFHPLPQQRGGSPPQFAEWVPLALPDARPRADSTVGNTHCTPLKKRDFHPFLPVPVSDPAANFSPCGSTPTAFCSVRSWKHLSLSVPLCPRPGTRR